MELKLTETTKENLFIINDYIENLKGHLKTCEKYKNDSQILLTNATFVRMYSNELIKYMIDVLIAKVLEMILMIKII